MTDSIDAKSGAVGLHYSESLERYRAEQLNRVKERLPVLRTMLLSAHVTQVEIIYDGVGDSGQIESVRYLSALSTEINPFGPTGELKDEIRDLFYDLLESRFGGWENNDGAYGDFNWQLVEDRVTHVHNERYSDIHSTEVGGL
jgi:hypothetical protein